MTIEQALFLVIWTVITVWIGNYIGYKHGENVGYDVGWEDGRKYKSPYGESSDLSSLWPKDEGGKDNLL